MSKYEPLRKHLQARSAEFVPMTFDEIEGVLGFELPNSKAYPAWWSNNPKNNVMTNEWLAAGYKTEQVDVGRGKLVFRRAASMPRPLDDAADAGRAPRHPRRHPLFGWMKGTVTIAPGTDLTQPADPDWGDLAWGKDSDVGKHGGSKD
jgi:hypothetical protein